MGRTVDEDWEVLLVSSTISQSTILHVFLVFFLALPFFASSFTLSYLNCSFTFHASRSQHDLPRPCGFWRSQYTLLMLSLFSVWAAADTQDQIALDAQIQTQTQLSLSLHTTYTIQQRTLYNATYTNHTFLKYISPQWSYIPTGYRPPILSIILSYLLRGWDI